MTALAVVGALALIALLSWMFWIILNDREAPWHRMALAVISVVLGVSITGTIVEVLL